MLQTLQRCVVHLCEEGRAREALQLLEAVRHDGEWRRMPPNQRALVYRLLGQAFEAIGQPRRAAAAYWRALRACRGRRSTPAGLHWGPLANVYRTLWRQSGHNRYYRQYLRFTREQTDAAQTALARRALRGTLARPRPLVNA